LAAIAADEWGSVMKSAGLMTGFSAMLLTLGGWFVAVPAEAAPASTVVTCGQTISASTRLANDLVDCPGVGLVIGADNITLDLAGHSISGVNAPRSEGIADDGHGGIKVENGTISNFFINGIGLRKAPRSVVSDMTIRQIGAGGVQGEASAGVLVEDSPRSSVSNSTVSNHVSAFQSDGVDVLQSAGAVVSGNRLTRNAWDGMFVYLSPRARVLRNTLDGNQNQGLEVNSGSDQTRLVGNFASDNVSNGLVVGAISEAQVWGNTLTGNGGSGLFMFDLLNSSIILNRAHENGIGIDLEGGQHGSTGDFIMSNDTGRNGAVGLLVENGSDDNLIARNLSNANQGSPGNGGGVVLLSVTGNTVRGNVADSNLSVGIGVFEGNPGDSTGNTVTDNVANSNHAHGIEVVTGTIDGGGNKAQHNTPLPNCLGVVCR
jgi:nitrous oxidase accessory protein NosD